MDADAQLDKKHILKEDKPSDAEDCDNCFIKQGANDVARCLNEHNRMRQTDKGCDAAGLKTSSLKVKAVTSDGFGVCSEDLIPFIKRAIIEAKKAIIYGDVPVGAVVTKDGLVVAAAYNRRERDKDAAAHAELLAIRKACKKLGRWNLSDCELFITLEPCAMCAGAIINSRIKRVVFGAFDYRFGCGGSLINLLNNSGLNHSAEVVGGILQEECAALLTDFFKHLRNTEAAKPH